MQNLDVSKTVNAWSSLVDTVFVPTLKLNTTDWFPCSTGLVDEVGEDESHPLASLIEIVGGLIEKYEDEHVPVVLRIVGPHINVAVSTG